MLAGLRLPQARDPTAQLPLRQEREQRRAKLQDLLEHVPLERLAKAVPGLRDVLPKPAAAAVEQGALAQNGSEPFECRTTAESIADAAEELAKAHYQALEALDGFAVSAALTACELRRKTADARLAVTGSSETSAKPRVLDAEAVTKGEAESRLLLNTCCNFCWLFVIFAACIYSVKRPQKLPMCARLPRTAEECDALQRRAEEARHLEETISKRCPQSQVSAMQRLYSN